MRDRNLELIIKLFNFRVYYMYDIYLAGVKLDLCYEF